MRLRVIRQETDTNPDVLIKRITSKLLERGYLIIETTDSTLVFDAPIQRSKSEGYWRVDQGKFEISKSKDSYVVTYTSEGSILGDILVASWLSLLGLFKAVAFILVAVSLIHSFIRIRFVNSANQSLLKEIVST